MIEEFFTIVGIDISKEYFDAVKLNSKTKVKRYQNNESGINEFIEEIPGDSWCVMESTGAYCYKLADELHERGYHVSIVNPLSVKRYGQMRLKRTKTDKSDAVLIAEYASAVQELKDYEPPTEGINDLEQLGIVLEQLIKQRTALLNQLEALKHMPKPSRDAIKAVEKMIAQLNKMIKDIEKKMQQKAITECSEVYEKATSVVGIGDRAAVLLITITNGFKNFSKHKELSSYIGSCPRIIQSGTSIKGKGHICKLGLKNVRAVLYMCAVAAARYNNQCRNLYMRLIAKGKPVKVAYMAVVNKLIRQVFACVKKNELFDNNYIYEFGN